MSETLQEHVESKIVRVNWHASGVPENEVRLLNAYCDKHFGGCRWQMLVHFRHLREDNNVMQVLAGEVMRAHDRIDKLEVKPKNIDGDKPKRFGSDRK